MSILDKVVAAIAPSAKDGEVNAIDLLKKDHDDVNALFKDYERLAERSGSRTMVCKRWRSLAPLNRPLQFSTSRRVPRNAQAAPSEPAAALTSGARCLISRSSAPRGALGRSDRRVNRYVGDQLVAHRLRG